MMNAHEEPSTPEVHIPTGSFGPVTQTDIVRFAGAGGDFNPLHHDPDFARQAGFDAPIAMGQFTAGLLSTWLTDWCGIENLRSFELRFKAPVAIGDTVDFSARAAGVVPSSDHGGDDARGPLLRLELTATVGTRTVAAGTATIAAPPLAARGEGTARTTPLWTPSRERVESSLMFRFQTWLEETRGVHTEGYGQLHTWSVEHLSDFWGAVWEYFDVIASAVPIDVLPDDSMPGAVWFPGARLNYAENLLRQARATPDATAIVGVHEDLPATRLTWAQLEAHVAAIAQELRRLCVGPGDRVAAVLPHIPQTVVALLATASVGAIWSVVNTDFGVTGVADRFAQIEPKVLFTVDGYEFGGKLRDMTGTIDGLRAVLPTVEHVIVVDQFSPDRVGPLPEGTQRFSDVVARSTAPSYEQVPFDHPLWVLYSSGTTGKPKGIVHSHGGILLEILKANGLHYDLGPEDRAYFAVSTTWVVWNMVVDTMCRGTSIVTYDGAPNHGGVDRHLRIVAETGTTFFGTGAAVLSMIEKSGATPSATLDLSRLRSMLVTGSPLPDSTWDWVYAHINEDIRLGSDSGGTDVATAFIGANPLQPVYRGQLMGAYLGVAAESWNPAGRRVWNEVGEFVVTRPMPSMPISFWADPDGSRYRAAYFEEYAGAWRHGDWVTELDGGHFVIHGRSDSTINRGGIRMGSADICQVVDSVPGVAASMVIGAELGGGDYYMPLFVVSEAGARVDDALREQIVTRLRSEVSPRYVPDEIIEAPAVPRTRTGKIMEVPIKRLFQGAGAETLNRGTAEDPAVLDWYAAQAAAFRAQRG